MYTPVAVAVFTLLATTSASTITAKAIPTLLRRQNAGVPSCSAFSSLESSCSAQTSNFANLDFTVQAGCLCSRSSTYDGSLFDGYFQTCLSYYATASPSFYSTDLDGDNLPTAPCALVASTTGASSASSSITASASRATTTFNANGAACTSWDLLQEECSQRTSGFGNLPFTSEASCLCYTGTTWAPQKYDGYWGSCLSFFKTESPALYSTWQAQDLTNPTPCALAGNVRNGPTLTAASTTTGNSTLARSSASSSRASSGVVSTSSASSSSSSTSRSTTTSATSTVLTTAGSATASRSSSGGNTYKGTAAMWLVTLVGAVAYAMTL